MILIDAPRRSAAIVGDSDSPVRQRPQSDVRPYCSADSGAHSSVMADTYTSIVVPLDLSFESDRAVGIAGALASIANLPVELVTVTGDVRQEPEKARLHQSASAHHLQQWSGLVLHDDDPAGALAKHLATLESPLVVMASSVHGPLAELLSLSTSAELLSRTACPVLLIGPHVESTWRAHQAQVVLCIGQTTHAEAMIPQMTTWSRTFGGVAPLLVEVVDPVGKRQVPSDVPDSAHVHRLAELLSEQGIVSSWDVLHDDDPVEALVRFGEKFEQTVFVVASEQWTDPAHVHLHSVSRHLAHRSTQPVLVIPPTCP